MKDLALAPTSITDSPDGDYLPNSISEITLKNPVTIKNASSVHLERWLCQWNIEEDEDYAQILGNFADTGYQPLCGKYSEAGTNEQSFNVPLYDGTQTNLGTGRHRLDSMA